MRYILGIGLLLLNALLIYVLYKNIQEPIAFQKIKQDRGDVVVDKLKEIRTTQEIYRAITGEFASSFDTLKYVLTNDSIPFEVLEQLDERNDVFKKTVTYTAAIDSINSLGINLDNLQFVPYTDNKSAFDIAADTITYQQTNVPVVQVGTRWKVFMGEYADPKYAKYDKSYDPNNPLRFGDMNAPNISGNWEQ
jgi:hypothetical protein